MVNGLFIVLEGGDYSGKKEQSILLAQHILDLSEDNDVLITHEPTRMAKEIKRRLKEDEDAYTNAEKMAELYIEDRRVHSGTIIEPSLREGVFVIGNRYAMSTCVYQSLQGITLSRLIEMHQHPEILRPDLTILLDITPKTGDQRASRRKEPPEKKFERKAFRDYVYQYYLEIASSEEYKARFGNVVIINGNESPGEVAQRIRSEFDTLYEIWQSNR